MKIHVGNLSKKITDSQLNELATPFGTLVSASVAMDRSSGTSKGFGFLEFGNADEARAAITGLHGREIDGQSLEVSEARRRSPTTPRD